MEYEEASQLYHGKCVMGRNEDSLLGESINDNKDGCETSRGGKLLDKIHRDGIPGTRGNGKRFEESIEFMPTRLDSAADCARVAKVFYEGPHTRPYIISTNQFDGLRSEERRVGKECR